MTSRDELATLCDETGKRPGGYHGVRAVNPVACAK